MKKEQKISKINHPKVFISYSRDNPEHNDFVLAFSDSLCEYEIDVELDQYHLSPPEGWPRWMDRQIRDSDFVLMICTETYYRRVMGEEEPGKGHGVLWESNLIYQHLYDAGTKNEKFVPILVKDGRPAFIPTPVKGSTHYRINKPHMSDSEYEKLLRRLTNQHSTPKPKPGSLPTLLRRERKTAFLESDKNVIQTFLKDIERFLLDELNDFMQPFVKYDKITLIDPTELYVPIDAIAGGRETRYVETFDYYQSFDEQKLAYSMRHLEESESIRVPWKELKKKNNRLTVLADPGMGKSSLLRMEGIFAVHAELEKLSLAGNIDGVSFPIYLKLSDLAKDGKEVIDGVLDLILRDYPNSASYITNFLVEKLRSGKCLLLLDALDEVSSNHWEGLPEKINRFARSYSCPITVTSRTVGYPGGILHGGKEVEIAPFTQKQIEQYIKTWFKKFADNTRNESKLAKGLLLELENKPQIRGLAQNPLLLSLICSLYQEAQLELPTRRVEIYEQAVSCILKKWKEKKEKKTYSDAIVKAKKELLEEVAYHFSCEGKEIFSIDELVDKIEEYLKGDKVPTDFTNMKTSELIEELSKGDGIIQKLNREGNRYIFLHRTFQEYFTASYLNRIIKRDTNKGIKVVLKYVWDYSWHETIGLVAGMMENPIFLIHEIYSLKDDIFHTQLLLVGRCIAECKETSNALLDHIIGRLFIWWKEYPNLVATSVVVSLAQKNGILFENIKALLKDPRLEYRYYAIWVLGMIGFEKALDSLLQVVDDPETSISLPAIRALGRIESRQTLDKLIELIKNGNESVKRQAAEAIGSIANDEAIDPLMNLLKLGDRGLMHCSAYAIGMIGSDKAVNSLLSLLYDKHDRRAGWDAAYGLSLSGNEQAVEPLIEILENDDWQNKMHACTALGGIKSDRAIGPLINLLHGNNVNNKAHAAYALGNIGSLEAVDDLIMVLNDQYINVKRAAIEALGEIGSEKAIEPLLKILRSDKELETITIESLARIGSEKALETLIDELKSVKNNEVKKLQDIVMALASTRNDRAVIPMIEALNDKNASEREFIISALGGFGSEKAVPVLICALKDQDANVRRSAADSLGRIGGKHAMKALTEALINDKSEAKWQIAAALEKIGTLETLETLIRDPKVNIYNRHIFSLAEVLSIRFSKENSKFIPLYRCVIDKYKPSPT